MTSVHDYGVGSVLLQLTMQSGSCSWRFARDSRKLAAVAGAGGLGSRSGKQQDEEWAHAANTGGLRSGIRDPYQSPLAACHADGFSRDGGSEGECSRPSGARVGLLR